MIEGETLVALEYIGDKLIQGSQEELRSLADKGADFSIGLGSASYDENYPFDSVYLTKNHVIGVNPFHRSQNSFAGFLGASKQTPNNVVFLHFSNNLEGAFRMRNHAPLQSSWPRYNHYDFHRWYVNSSYSPLDGPGLSEVTNREVIAEAQKTGRKIKIRLDQGDCSAFLRPTVVFFKKEEYASPKNAKYMEEKWPDGDICAVTHPVLMTGDFTFDLNENTKHFVLAELIVNSANTVSALILCEWRGIDLICHSRPTGADRLKYHLRHLSGLRHIVSGRFLNRKREVSIPGKVSWFLENSK